MEGKKTVPDLILDRVKFEVGQEIGISRRKKAKNKEKY